MEGSLSEWRHGLARFHYIDIKAFHQGREIWHVPPLANIESLDIGATAYQDSVYTTYHVSTEKAEK